jgi:hypothetical protein
MVSPRLTTAAFALLANALVFASACGGKGSGAPSGTGGTTAGGSGGAAGAAVGSGGASSSGGATGTGGMTVDAGAAGAGGGTGSGGSCTAAPPSVQSAGVALSFPMELVYEGRPFTFGEANAVSSALSVVPLNLRFYVSEAELLTAGGGSVPVDIVTDSGTVAPYGVFFFNADDPNAQTLRVRAPAGAYTGLKFSVGLTAACNRNGAAGKAFPLSEDSQMVWSMGFGYLFLLYTSQVSMTATPPDGGTSDAGTASTLPVQIHMGGDLRDLSRTSGVTVRISGEFSVPTSGSGPRRIQVAMDQIFKAATSDVDVSDYPFPFAPLPMLDGERLRRAGGNLPLFVFAP